MNIIEFLKKGSGIYIKPSQRGSFTKYCNGKVTNECILRGKNSPDPKIRKKATFALNVRHFKHKSGGQIIREFKKINSRKWHHKNGGQIKIAQTGTKLGNFFNSELGQSLIGGLTNLATASIQNKKINSERDLAKSKIQADALELKVLANNQAIAETNLILNNMNNDNSANSDVFRNYIKNLLLNNKLIVINLNTKNLENLIDSQISAEKSSNWNNSISNILLNSLSVVGNYLSNKQKLPV